MTRKAPALLCAATGAIVLAAIAAATISISAPNESDAMDSREFQTLVGGLGLGSALDLAAVPAAFDPRLEAAPVLHTQPFPGGAAAPADSSE